MIQKIARSILRSYYKPVEKFIQDPFGTQRDTLSYLLKHGRDTFYGREHNFRQIKGDTDFRAKVPLIAYEDLRPYLDKVIVEREGNVLWDTPVKWFAMSSGTTEDKSKYIPVTRESLFNGSYRRLPYVGTYAIHHPRPRLSWVRHW